MSPSPVTYRVGVDIGGTFTDIVLLGSDGTIHTKKISSSVGDYARPSSRVSPRCSPRAASPVATSRRSATARRLPPTPSWR